MKINRTDLEMTAGSDQELTYVRYKYSNDPKNKVYTPFVTGETLTFTVKANITDEIPLIEKQVTIFTDGDAVITLLPSDTIDLEGVYYYDVWITQLDGKTFPYVELSNFVVNRGTKLPEGS